MKDIIINGKKSGYKIMKNGQVISRLGKELKPIPHNCGYERTCICIKNVKVYFYIHRLVAQYFMPNPHNKPQVNHKNGIKNDNRLENLEWATSSENMKHAYKLGLLSVKGERHNVSKVTEKQVLEIRELRSCGVSGKELSEKYGITQQTICNIHKRRNWNHV